jgi:hypothetical protein
MAAPNQRSRTVEHEQYPFDTLEEAFGLLVSGPSPLCINGALIGLGLPPRPIPLDELRNLLLRRSVSFAARDAALEVLVRRAQRERGGAMVGLAGVLLPGLRRAAFPLTKACPLRAADVEAEMLAGLIEAVAAWCLGGERVAARLTWAAARKARALLGAELEHLIRRGRAANWAEPHRPGRHPDLVLARAVEEGVVTASEAELISATRIGEVPLRDVAAEWGVPYDTLQKRRRRAEHELVTKLLRPALSAKGAKTPVIGVRVGPGRGAGHRQPNDAQPTETTEEVTSDTHRRCRPSRDRRPVQVQNP